LLLCFLFSSLAFTGTSTLISTTWSHDGYSYGFITKGKNYDGTWILQGNLVVNPVTPTDTTAPVTTVSIEPSQNG
jgi:hypothetical protein